MSNVSDPPYIPGPMMTLAGLAANAAIERPSGETIRQQTLRILAGINSQLLDKQLATAGQWNAIWLALSPDRANLAYIAQNTSTNSFAVCLRGTLFSSLVDLGEDLKVGKLAQFTAVQRAGDTEPVLVSSGGMQAFAETA
ncbi:MAG TPA: lipase, partial [Blastocatellia bacterium]|nr:lipase [Blastocatellia bacterium]